MSKKKYCTPTTDMVTVENDVLLVATSNWEDIDADAKNNNFIEGSTWDDEESSQNETNAWNVWGDD